MQNRMKTHQLNQPEIDNILNQAQSGTFTTIGEDGYPYSVPINFAYSQGKIYMHGLAVGQKIDNLKANSKVGFEVHNMYGLLYDENPASSCSVNTKYNSVIIKGDAFLVETLEDKKEALTEIVRKYTPELEHLGMKDATLEKTAVIVLIIKECTGKYYE